MSSADNSFFNFNLIHINCRSLSANFSQITTLISNANHDFSAIAVSETWLNDCNQSIFQIPGYYFMSLNRNNNKRGGGVGIYVKDSFVCNEKNILTVSNDDIECLVVEISLQIGNHTFSFLIGTLYRPPGSSVGNFCREMEKLLVNITQRKNDYKLVALLGDYNIDLMTSYRNKSTNDFLNLLNDHGFLQMITKPTRVNNTSATLIDNIFINNITSSSKSAILYNDISDHFPILLHCTFPIKKG